MGDDAAAHVVPAGQRRQRTGGACLARNACCTAAEHWRQGVIGAGAWGQVRLGQVSSNTWHSRLHQGWVGQAAAEHSLRYGLLRHMAIQHGRSADLHRHLCVALPQACASQQANGVGRACESLSPVPAVGDAACRLAKASCAVVSVIQSWRMRLHQTHRQTPRRSHHGRGRSSAAGQQQ